MTSHEQNLILKVADEVRAADRMTVDPDAERLIRAEVAAQPHAAYILTQRVIVQNLALQQARARIDELESRLRSAGSPVGGPVGSTDGAAPPSSASSSGARSGVGDFLKTAAAAAAGTIGAELVYDGLRHWAAGHGGVGSGLLGGLTGGGFLSSGANRGNFEADADTPYRDGGGEDETDEADDNDVSEASEWGDDGADQDTDGGDVSGGDWGDDGNG